MKKRFVQWLARMPITAFWLSAFSFLTQVQPAMLPAEAPGHSFTCTNPIARNTAIANSESRIVAHGHKQHRIT